MATTATTALHGHGGDDNLKGFGGDDAIFGGDDNDTLVGMDGDDGLVGQGGDDHIHGGLGRDIYWGGDGADAFVWYSTSEATFVTDPVWINWPNSVNPNTIDQLNDFDPAEGDLIHLSQIDADVLADGDQAFNWIGTAQFSGTPGEINYYHFCGSTFIQMQTGDSTDVEAMIVLTGIHTPQASWFAL